MNVTGHIEKRSNSSYTIVIDYGRDPLTGKRIRKKKAVKMTKKQAEKELRRMLNEIENGTYVEPSDMTVGQLLSKWYEMHCETNLEKTTCANYKYVIDAHLLPYFSHIPAQQLKPFHIQEYITEKTKSGLSSRSVLYHYQILNTAFKFGKCMGIVKNNPCDNVTAPKRKKPTIKFLTPEQFAAVYEEAKNMNEEYAAAIMGAAHTGMRRGEIAALTWDSVNFDEKYIYVNKSAATVPKVGRITKKPKTKRGIRSIPMTDDLFAFLKEHRKKQLEYMLLLGEEYQKNNLVFCKADGSPLGVDYISGFFKKVVNKLNYEGITFHSLRHTFVSLLIVNGVDIKTIQDLVGHESAATTYDVYGHLMPGKKTEAIQQLQAAYQNWCPIGAQTDQTPPKNSQNENGKKAKKP